MHENFKCHQIGKIISATKCNECYRLLSFAICLHCGIALSVDNVRHMLHKHFVVRWALDFTLFTYLPFSKGMGCRDGEGNRRGMAGRQRDREE
ncbi:hypothetical protein DVH24_030491 [Malus domestica]|uniref:Uncharacterized protein n=1 Tax=Malus domestica TaxID=3750 RepID=A0A498JX79_MALDO|nr:hypothetical protein DVH24_030491 [Malus domestica]